MLNSTTIAENDFNPNGLINTATVLVIGVNLLNYKWATVI
jgi:hypothetical protein